MQSRLRISAPFYLILWNADHAIKKSAFADFFYFIVRRCHSVGLAPGYNGGLNMCRPVYMLQLVHKSDNDL